MSDQIPPVPPPVSFPVQAPAPAGDKKGLAIASLVLGILPFCGSAFWYCGIPLAIVGMILAGIGILIAIVSAIITFTSGGSIIQQLQNQIISNMGY